MQASKKKFTSTFSYFTFLQPPPKTKMWTTNRWGGPTKREPHRLIIMIGQRKTLNNSQMISITLFCAQCCYAFFHNHYKLCNYVEPK